MTDLQVELKKQSSRGNNRGFVVNGIIIPIVNLEYKKNLRGEGIIIKHLSTTTKGQGGRTAKTYTKLIKKFHNPDNYNEEKFIDEFINSLYIKNIQKKDTFVDFKNKTVKQMREGGNVEIEELVKKIKKVIIPYYETLRTEERNAYLIEESKREDNKMDIHKENMTSDDYFDYQLKLRALPPKQLKLDMLKEEETDDEDPEDWIMKNFVAPALVEKRAEKRQQRLRGKKQDPIPAAAPAPAPAPAPVAAAAAAAAPKEKISQLKLEIKEIKKEKKEHIKEVGEALKEAKEAKAEGNVKKQKAAEQEAIASQAKISADNEGLKAKGREIAEGKVEEEAKANEATSEEEDKELTTMRSLYLNYVKLKQQGQIKGAKERNEPLSADYLENRRIANAMMFKEFVNTKKGMESIKKLGLTPQEAYIRLTQVPTSELPDQLRDMVVSNTIKPLQKKARQKMRRKRDAEAAAAADAAKVAEAADVREGEKLALAPPVLQRVPSIPEEPQGEASKQQAANRAKMRAARAKTLTGDDLELEQAMNPNIKLTDDEYVNVESKAADQTIQAPTPDLNTGQGSEAPQPPPLGDVGPQPPPQQPPQQPPPQTTQQQPPLPPDISVETVLTNEGKTIQDKIDETEAEDKKKEIKDPAEIKDKIDDVSQYGYDKQVFEFAISQSRDFTYSQELVKTSKDGPKEDANERQKQIVKNLRIFGYTIDIMKPKTNDYEEALEIMTFVYLAMEKYRIEREWKRSMSMLPEMLENFGGVEEGVSTANQQLGVITQFANPEILANLVGQTSNVFSQRRQEEEEETTDDRRRLTGTSRRPDVRPTDTASRFQRPTQVNQTPEVNRTTRKPNAPQGIQKVRIPKAQQPKPRKKGKKKDTRPRMDVQKMDFRMKSSRINPNLLFTNLLKQNPLPVGEDSIFRRRPIKKERRRLSFNVI